MSTETILPDVGFSREQKEYLQGYFTGLACSGLIPFVGHLPNGRITNVPAPGLVNSAAEPEASAEETVYGTPVSDLCEQEIWKLEQHGLDVWDKLVAHADNDKFPDKPDTFRFRYHGLFYVAPAQKSFMLRCRIPAGELTSIQLRGLADLAEEWGGRYADITTRANFQIREIAPRNMVKCLLKLQEIGLTARGSGVDNVRNKCVAVAAAIIRVFVENGDRTNRKRARLKYVIDKWGIPKYVEEVEKKLVFPLLRLPLDQCEPRKAPIQHGHIGVFGQVQPGLNYIGAVITVGRMKPKQMRRIADVAQNYGSGEIRLTVWQNLLIPNVPEHFVETVKKNLVKMGFHHHSATAISGGLIACTGNTGCKWAATNTKGQAVLLARHLQKKLQLDQPINIHLTGCPNSCAQHYIGDIGLLGAKVDQGGDTVEGYHVVLGGGFGEKQAVAREVFRGVPFNELPTLLEHVLKVYLAKRNRGESFVEFTRRHSVKELQELFSE